MFIKKNAWLKREFAEDNSPKTIKKIGQDFMVLELIFCQKQFEDKKLKNQEKIKF